MNPILLAAAVGMHVFLVCLNLPTFSPGFAVNIGSAAFWLLIFFRALFHSPQVGEDVRHD